MPYQKRNTKLPELPEGMRYGNLGVQENRNCTVIMIRMKGNRKRWSTKEANNMAKLLCRKENRELVQTVNKYAEALVFNIRMTEIITTLSIVKTSKKDGKGNPYVDVINKHIPLQDAAQDSIKNSLCKSIIVKRKRYLGKTEKQVANNVLTQIFLDFILKKVHNSVILENIIECEECIWKHISSHF